MRVTWLPCIVKMRPAVELLRGVNSLIGSYLVKLKKKFMQTSYLLKLANEINISRLTLLYPRV